jgi:hypothetical protein
MLNQGAILMLIGLVKASANCRVRLRTAPSRAGYAACRYSIVAGAVSVETSAFCAK